MNEKTSDDSVVDRLAAAYARIEELRDCVEDLCQQFAYSVPGPALSTGGLSALESGFAVLGWSDPQPVPERGCDEPGCTDIASCGWPDSERYRRTCGKHYRTDKEQQNG